MREYFMGVLAAALVYPLVWHEAGAQDEVAITRSSAAKGSSRAEPSTRTRSSTAAPAANGAGARRQAAPGALRTVPQQGGGHAALPRDDKRGAPTSPVLAPLPQALPRTLEQMQELQHLASDPDKLAERVQKLENTDEDLAELEAFAQKFVEVPKNRVDRHMTEATGSGARGSGEDGSSASGRRR